MQRRRVALILILTIFLAVFAALAVCHANSKNITFPLQDKGKVSIQLEPEVKEPMTLFYEGKELTAININIKVTVNQPDMLAGSSLAVVVKDRDHSYELYRKVVAVEAGKAVYTFSYRDAAPDIEGRYAGITGEFPVNYAVTASLAYAGGKVEETAYAQLVVESMPPEQPVKIISYSGAWVKIYDIRIFHYEGNPEKQWLAMDFEVATSDFVELWMSTWELQYSGLVMGQYGSGRYKAVWVEQELKEVCFHGCHQGGWFPVASIPISEIPDKGAGVSCKITYVSNDVNKPEWRMKYEVYEPAEPYIQQLPPFTFKNTNTYNGASWTVTTFTPNKIPAGQEVLVRSERAPVQKASANLCTVGLGGQTIPLDTFVVVFLQGSSQWYGPNYLSVFPV